MLLLPRLSFGNQLPPKLKLDDKFLRKFQNHIIKQHLQSAAENSHLCLGFQDLYFPEIKGNSAGDANPKFTKDFYFGFQLSLQ